MHTFNMRDCCQLIIFDWDGTLMDSEAKIVRCFQAACEDLALTAPDHNVIKNIIGLDLATSVRQLLPLIGEGQLRQVIARYREHFLHLDRTEMNFFPDVLPGLAQLRNWGYRLAVATGKARRGLDRLLQLWDLGEYFETSRCADEALSKPDPKMLWDILAYTGLRAEAAVMVGDTVYDMAMARHADMARMAVSYGVHDRQRLLDYQPLSCVDSFAELLRCFEPPERS